LTGTLSCHSRETKQDLHSASLGESISDHTIFTQRAANALRD
jgi:hypothetical protein